MQARAIQCRNAVMLYAGVLYGPSFSRVSRNDSGGI